MKQELLEYLELKAQAEKEKEENPCDVAEGVYMLVDDASPSESPLYLHSLQTAYWWAVTHNNFGEETWAVSRVGEKVL